MEELTRVLSEISESLKALVRVEEARLRYERGDDVEPIIRNEADDIPDFLEFEEEIDF